MFPANPPKMKLPNTGREPLGQVWFPAQGLQPNSKMIPTLWQERCYSHNSSGGARLFAAQDRQTQRFCCRFTEPGENIEIFIAPLIHSTASMGRPCSNAPIKFISVDFSPDYHETPADTHNCPHPMYWDHFCPHLATFNVSNISSLASLSLESEIRV